MLYQYDSVILDDFFLDKGLRRFPITGDIGVRGIEKENIAMNTIFRQRVSRLVSGFFLDVNPAVKSRPGYIGFDRFEALCRDVENPRFGRAPADRLNAHGAAAAEQIDENSPGHTVLQGVKDGAPHFVRRGTDGISFGRDEF